MARLLALLLVLTACGDPVFEPRSKVLGYRVLAISADLPEARPDQQVKVRVYEYLPEEMGDPTREWSFCAFSLGSLHDYDCYDPSLEVPLGGDGDEVLVDLPVLFAAISMGAGAAGIGLSDQTGAVVDLEQQGIPAYVRLKSGPADARHEAVFRILVRTRAPANANPSIEGIRFPNLSGVVSSAPSEATLELEVVMAEGGRETFDALDNRCYANALEDAGDDPVKRTAAYEGCLEPATEDLIYQWFSTGGEFSNPIALNDDTETILELPEEDGPLHIWVVARDGRGGVAISDYMLEVESKGP